MRVRAKRKVKQTLKLYKRRYLGGLSQFCMGKVEEVCEVGRMGEEKTALETVESWDETLVTQ